MHWAAPPVIRNLHLPILRPQRVRKKGDDLTKEEAFAAFIASDEAIAGLEADIAAEPAIKIIDKMLAKAGNKKLRNQM